MKVRPCMPTWASWARFSSLTSSVAPAATAASVSWSTSCALDSDSAYAAAVAETVSAIGRLLKVVKYSLVSSIRQMLSSTTMHEAFSSVKSWLTFQPSAS